MKNKNFIFLVIILFVIFFYLFSDSFDKEKILFGSDTIALSLPFKTFAKEMIKNGELPLWLPYIYFGLPLLDSTNLIFFYPTDFIFYFLPIDIHLTYTIDFILHLLLAFLGMYLFLKVLELKEEASILGAFFYMLSGTMVSFAYVGHFGNIKAASLIPFIFYFIKKGIESEKLIHFINASIFFALQILGIGMQIMAYTFLAVLVYFLYEIIKNKKEKIFKFIIYFIILIIFSILLSAPQFFQSLGYTKHSWRANFDYKDFISWSFYPIELITFFLPQFFGLKDNLYWGNYDFNQTTYYLGIICFLLLPFAFYVKKFKNENIIFLAISILFLILSFGGFTPIYKIFYYLPVFNNFRNPARFLYIFNFTIITLASIGFNNIRSIIVEDRNIVIDKNNAINKIWLKSLMILSVIIIFLIILGLNNNLIKNIILEINKIIRKHPVEDKINFLIPMIKQDIFIFIFVTISCLTIIYLMIKQKIKNVFVIFVIMIILHSIDMLRINKQFVQFINLSQFKATNEYFEKIFKNDNSIFRIADFSNIWYPPNMNILSKIESITGYHGLAPERQYMLLLNQAFNNLYINNLLNVKYYITNSDLQIPEMIKFFDNGRIKIYQSLKVKDRFIFFDKIRKFKNKEEMLLYLKGLSDELKEALVFDDILLTEETGENKYEINLIKYFPTEIKLNIRTQKQGILFISNMYYPKWKAKINGILTKIYDVNFAGMGILLNKGENDVIIFYDKKSLFVSITCFIIAIVLYLLLLLKSLSKIKF